MYPSSVVFLLMLLFDKLSKLRTVEFNSLTLGGEICSGRVGKVVAGGGHVVGKAEFQLFLIK